MPLKIYGEKSTGASWAKHLANDSATRKPEAFFYSIISKYIKYDGKTLDAGCGLGYLVSYLSYCNYEAVGVDFSKVSIQRSRLNNKHSPQLQVGDLLNLPYQKNIFDTCISEGVFEHFEAGPQLPINSVKQVLKNGGYLVITIPYYNPVRKIRKLFTSRYHYLDQESCEEFFEYAFTKKEIKAALESSGFTVEKIVTISPIETLKIDISGMKKLLGPLLSSFDNSVDLDKKTNGSQSLTPNLQSMISIICSKIVRSEPFRNFFGHMILVIAHNNKQNN